MASKLNKRDSMIGLLLHCPSKKRAKDCPFAAARELAILERLAWLKSLSNSKIAQLYREHMKCLGLNRKGRR